jgi:hypothetical protein
VNISAVSLKPLQPTLPCTAPQAPPSKAPEYVIVQRGAHFYKVPPPGTG